MALFTAVTDVLVGSPYSAAIAIAIITVLLLIVMWAYGTDDVTQGVTKWTGIIAVGAYGMLGYIQSKKPAASPAGMLASLV